MKFLTILLTLGSLAVAGPVFVTLDNPNQTAVAGTTLTFSGILDNPAANGTRFVNGDSITLATLTFDDSVFLVNAPVSLSSPGTSGSFILFTVDTTAGLEPNVYNGTIHILGGSSDTDMTDIGSAAFSVTIAAVPEPATWVVALPLLFWLLLRCSRQAISRKSYWAGTATANPLSNR